MPTTIPITCRCSARYEAPARLAGKRVKCRRCGAPIPIPAFEDDGLALDIVDLQPAIIDQPRDVIVGSTGPPVAWRPAAVAQRVTSSGRMLPFWGDCMRSLIFIAEPGAIAPFLVVATMAAIQPLLGFAGCLGFIAQIIATGWILSFLFSVVLEAASGETRLPELELLDDPVDTVITPLFKFLAAWVVCFGPAAVYARLVDVDWTAPYADVGLMVLVGVGVVLLPMTTLVIAMGGIGSFARIDLLLATIGKTIIPYTATCILTAAVVAGSVVIQAAIMVGGAGKHPLIILCILQVAEVYAMIVVMRFVGFYYHHFKRSFAWDWG